MGAGASAASLPIEERRVLCKDLRSKYTRSDLDALDEEEKQAWLEVLEEQNEAEAPEVVTAAEGADASEEVPAGVGGGEDGIAGGGAEEPAAALPLSSDQTNLPISAPEVTVREAAEAAAALTGASNGRKSGWDLSGAGDTGVRPQGKNTRLSFLLASEGNEDGDVDGDGVDDRGDVGPGGDRCSEGGEPNGATAGNDCGAGGAGEGRRRRQSGAKAKRGSAELPAWKKAAQELETPNELCVGDVVRARDKECNGMWFEGVLTAIHDETTFEVELSSDEDDEIDGGGPQRITVGIEDVIRVMPWFCIEVGDMVECQPEGSFIWVRGTVVNVAHAEALYDVALESFEDESDRLEGAGGASGNPSGEECGAGRHGNERGSRDEGEEEGKPDIHRVPDSRIRKILSGRQAASKRWKKAFLASCVTSALGRLVGGDAAPLSTGN